MAWLAWCSSVLVLALVLLCCGLGYIYQGPPFRLGYRGLGEPLCWLAFGPCATAAALMVLEPQGANVIPWATAWMLGAGPGCGHQPGAVLLPFPSGGARTRPMANAHRWCGWAPPGQRP